MGRPLAVIDADEAGYFNRRFGVRLGDGGRVEAVLYRGDTLCVSCQVGCAVGCPFCASGARGFARNLSEAEMRAQLDAVREATGVRPARVTVSGVGEPLHNYEAVAAFTDGLVRERVKVSLTTSGGPVARLARALTGLAHNGLTVSVHAGSESTRARLVPRGPSLAALFATLAGVAPGLSARRRKKTALAYLLLAGENDGEDELAAFARAVVPLGVSVHLYAYNEVEGAGVRAADRSRYEAAYGFLRSFGIPVRMSSAARREANGGCGTLTARRGEGGAA